MLFIPIIDAPLIMHYIYVEIFIHHSQILVINALNHRSIFTYLDKFWTIKCTRTNNRKIPFNKQYRIIFFKQSCDKK